MVKLRLTRTGRKNFAAYRIIAVDSRRKRETKAIEILGHYLPHSKELNINAERAQYWLNVGAQPSDTVRGLLIRQGVIEKPASAQKFSKQPGKQRQARIAKKNAPREEAKPATPAVEAAAEVEEVVVEETAAVETEVPTSEAAAQ